MVGEEGHLLLGPLPVGDIHHHALPEAGPAGFVGEQECLVPQPNHSSVLGHQAIFGPERLAGRIGSGVFGENPLAILFVKELGPQSQVLRPFVWGVAQNVLNLWTDVDRRALPVDRVDVGDHRDLFHQLPVLCFGFR